MNRSINEVAPKIPEEKNLGLSAQRDRLLKRRGIFLPLQKEGKGIRVGTDIDKFVSVEEGS